MVFESLAAIGAAGVVQLIFQQVLKLGTAAAEDYVKDFFKGCLKGGVALANPDLTKKAAASAVKEFLTIVSDELEDQGTVTGRDSQSL